MSEFSLKHLKKAKRFLEAGEHDYHDKFYDTAVSHAYYAMHHAARALLLLIGESPKTHSGVIARMWKNREKLGLAEEDVRNLSRILRMRVESDYGVDFEIPDKDTAEEILSIAKLFVSKSEKIVSEWMAH